MTRALLLIDLQNDFMPGGAMAVPDGDAVIPLVNRWHRDYPVVVATRDWHPADHVSFAANHDDAGIFDTVTVDGLEQILWPVHCVQGTSGAAFHPDLETEALTAEIRKGVDADIDCYSGFFSNGRRRSTGLAEWLRDHDVDALDLAGVATDYCVAATARDAADLGFDTRVLLPGCRGVDLRSGDVDRQLEDLAAAGVRLERSLDAHRI